MKLDRYKETLSRSTRGWRERLHAQNNGTPDLGPQARDMDGSFGQSFERIASLPHKRIKDEEENESSCVVIDQTSECESSSSGNYGNDQSHTEEQRSRASIN
mgnify:CR=1 FL=1